MLRERSPRGAQGSGPAIIDGRPHANPGDGANGGIPHGADSAS